MVFNKSKFKMSIPGFFFNTMGPREINKIVKTFVEESKANRIKSVGIERSYNHQLDSVEYEIYFDSSYWTGIDFNPNNCNEKPLRQFIWR